MDALKQAVMALLNCDDGVATGILDRVGQVWGWTLPQLATEVDGIAARTGVVPAAVVWWLYGAVDMLKTPETRSLLHRAARLAVCMDRMQPGDADHGPTQGQ